MPAPARQPRLENPQARTAILTAASHEFGRQGLAGARTQQIANAAGVNIALLFYYFKTKEDLYEAVIENVFHRWYSTLKPVLSEPGHPEQRLTAFIRASFDFMAAEPACARLVQLELLRPRDIDRLAPLIRRYVKPVRKRLDALLRRGIKEGAFVKADPEQLITSIMGVITSYFNHAGTLKVIHGKDPFSRERLSKRRDAVQKFVQRAVVLKSGAARK